MKLYALQIYRLLSYAKPICIIKRKSENIYVAPTSQLSRMCRSHRKVDLLMSWSIN